MAWRLARRLLAVAAILSGLPACDAESFGNAGPVNRSEQLRPLPDTKVTIKGKGPADLGFWYTNGGRVQTVAASGIAQKKGVKPGWMIHKVDGHEIRRNMTSNDIGNFIAVAKGKRKPFDIVFETEPAESSGGQQWTQLKVYLKQAWIDAGAATKLDVQRRGLSMQEQPRVSKGGFIESFRGQSPGASTKFKEGSELMKLFKNERGEIHRWFEKVFDLGLRLMEARGDHGLNRRPELDKHAFAYAWTVAHGFQKGHCNFLLTTWCTFTPDKDEFLEPWPKTAAGVDYEGPLARARSKYSAERVAAGYPDAWKTDVRKWFKKVKEESDIKKLDKNRWVRFQYAKYAETLDQMAFQNLHFTLMACWEAAKEHGWKAHGGMRGLGFQYMSLLLDEFPVKNVHYQVKTPDNLMLLTNDADWPDFTT